MTFMERVILVTRKIAKDINLIKVRILALESAPAPTVDEGTITRKVNESVDSLKSQIPALVAPTISTEIAKVVGGAPDTFDTLKEIADYVESDKTGASAMATAINNRLRIDEVQALTEQQQKNVLDSLGLNDVDFVSIYEKELNS